MTGFVDSGMLTRPDSAEVARVAFNHFFIPNGLPYLVLIDVGSENRGALEAMCKQLAISWHPVSAQNHRAVRVERFFRYLNKAEPITVLDAQTVAAWYEGIVGAVYAWNASPIDGTVLVRSVVAKGREFLFPLDVALRGKVILPPEGSQPAMDHVTAAHPLIQQQRKLLQLINDERRLQHRDLRNRFAKTRTFELGDLVIVRRLVQSSVEAGRVAKLSLKARGPYIVIRRANPGSYIVRKIPFLQGAGQRGRERKVKVELMEKLPSTLCVHKKVDGTDTRFIAMEHQQVGNPLEPSLGVHRFGRYQKNEQGDAADRRFAFVRLNDLWDEEVESSSSEEEDTEQGQEHPLVRGRARGTKNATGTAGHEGGQDDETHHGKGNETGDDGTTSSTKMVQTANGPRGRSGGPARQRQKRGGDTPVRRSTRLRIKPPRTDTHVLWNRISRSRDKLFLVAYTPRGGPCPKLYIVQVDLTQTEEGRVRLTGEYNARWWRPHHEDSRWRCISECRFWPDIWELCPDNTFGPGRAIKPAKAEATIRKRSNLGWYQLPLNLAETMISGPFDFVRVPMRAGHEAHRVPASVWAELRRSALERNVDIAELDVVP